MRTVSLLLVDDHVMVRKAFRLMLETSGTYAVIAEADNGESAYARYLEMPTDVVVMDLAMPGIGGVEAIKRIVARDRKARILALSAHEDTLYPRRALQAGALGYLSKRSCAELLFDALTAVTEGRIFVDPDLAQRMVAQSFSGAVDPLAQLSEREFEVFIRLAQGDSVKRIAEVLTISPRTVGTHLYHVKQKLNAANQADLTLIAMRRGLIES